MSEETMGNRLNLRAAEWAMSQAEFTKDWPIQDQHLPGVMWRSMDTAPKDGTTVLLWGEAVLDGCQFEASYNLASWYDGEWKHESGEGNVLRPTAWAPLTPPKDIG